MKYLNNEEREVEVFISLSISKSVKIKVSDYKNYGIAKDEDGENYEDIDFSECDLKRAVKEQVDLPKDWDINEFEVMLE